MHSHPPDGPAAGQNTQGPPAPLAQNIAALWLLQPGVAFLNHGSFGAVPRAVFDAQDEWRRRIEAEPVELLGRRCFALLDEARAKVGEFLGMDPADFGFVTNATEGVNAVLRSMDLAEGDEVVSTDHVYHAVRQAMKFEASRRRARYREIDVPVPARSAEHIADVVLAGLGDRTRLLVIDHVTSPTALVFPVERIAAACAARGVDVLVDGAHAPGMLPLDVAALGRAGVAYYAGNLHKWVCAPKGAGFLWVRPDRKHGARPLVISHFLGEGMGKEFGWQGTRDISAWLAAPRAIDYVAATWGWQRVREHNHALNDWAHRMLCRRLGVEPISPPDGSLLGSMASMPLPPPLEERLQDEAVWEAMQQRLYSEFRVEAPLVKWGTRRLVRVACQVYNTPRDFERLAEAVERMKDERGRRRV